MGSIFFLLAVLGCGKDINDVPEEGDSLVPTPEEPSSGDCPDMTQSHTTSFTSSGQDRTVTIVVPDEPVDNMPLVFFFHGLLDTVSTPNPTQYMANALGLQAFANEERAVIVLPQSGVLERMGYEFFMWDIEDGESPDLTLFDDLRSCAYSDLGIDLFQVHSMGFSGGALFSTVVARERSPMLASMVEMSGGSDISMLTFDEPLSTYTTPENPVPALLISGGSDDQWPGNGATLVHFSSATDTLQDKLVEDGHFVVRCEHNQGHTVPYTASLAARQWVTSHKLGEPSPIEASGIDNLENYSDWCVISGE